ncbi:lipid II flippase MurJ [Serinibacter arcticus]|uniref:lipid II flippase MurJ n=1 Tax=Serinibacter arcticus TaxID=1655435 RepID=UPI0022A67828|nr:lipid II flippase MurJ [Serinibacter arcticus]
MAAKQRGLAGAAAVMFSGTFVSRGLGFVRTAILAVAIASVGGASTAFTVANSLPNTIYMLLAGGVINAILVPQLVRAARAADGGRDYTNRLLTVAGVGLLVITALLTLGATLLVQLYGGDMRPEWLPVAYAFAFWCVPQVFFYGLYTLLGQVLNARGVFGPYMWAPTVNNVVAIIGLVAYLVIFGAMPPEQLAAAEFGADRVMLLAGMATLGVAAQALVLVVPLYRSGFRYRPAWGLKGLGGASRMAGWTFAALGAGQLGLIAVSRVASSAENVAATTPGMTADAIPGNFVYATAFMIFMLPQSLVVVSLMTAIFTRLSTKAAAKDGGGVRDDLSLGIRTVGVFTVPASVLLLVLSVPVARAITVGSASLDADAALGNTIWALALGIPALAMWSAVQRAYYAYEDARSLFWIQVAMAVVVAGGTLSSLLWLHPANWVPAAGVWISVSYGIGALVGFLGLRRRLPSLDGSRILLTHLRLTLAAVPMALLGGLAIGLWGADRGLVVSVVQLVVIGGAMGALYLWLAQRLGVTEIAFVTSRVASLARPLTARLRTMTGARRGAPRETTSTGEHRVVSTDSVTGGMLLADRFLVGEQITATATGVRRWTGHDSILERDVEVLSVSGDHADEMLDAARRAALVTDPRLPKVLRVGEYEGTGYVVLEPLGGTPLTDVLAHGPLTPDVARSVAGEVAGALEAGRRRGVHHGALTADSVTITSAGAVRVAGLGVDGAARGVSRSAGEAARADAESLVHLLRTMLGEKGDDAARAELLAAVPETVRTASNLVVALAPWRPVPPASALTAGQPGPTSTAAVATLGEDVDPEATHVADDDATSTPAPFDPEATHVAGSEDPASDEEIVEALSNKLVAEAGATGAPGVPGWAPTLAEGPSTGSFAAIDADAVPSSGPAAAGDGAVAAGAAGAGTGAAVAGGSGLGRTVRDWFRRLDAVIPAERHTSAASSAPIEPAPAGGSPGTDAAEGDRRAEAEPEPDVPVVPPDTSGWTVRPTGNLEAAPSTFSEALGDPATLAEAPPSSRHSSGAGDGAIAAFTSGLLSRVGARGEDDPAGTTATGSEREPDVSADHDDHHDDDVAAGTHVLPATTAGAAVTSRISEAAEAAEPTPVRGLERPEFRPVHPAQPADAPAPASIVEPTPAPRPAPKPTKQPKPTAQPKARPAADRPVSAARDADRYEVPDRRPPGRIPATPFVLVLVLAGVVWVCYLAVTSLFNAARGGSDEPAPSPSTTSTQTLLDDSTAGVVLALDAADADTDADITDDVAAPPSPADLPAGTTTPPNPLLIVGPPQR